MCKATIFDCGTPRRYLSRDMTKPTKWLCAQRSKLVSLATHWAHGEDSNQTGRMPRLIWVFAGRTAILLVLSCRGSFVLLYCNSMQLLILCFSWTFFIFFCVPQIFTIKDFEPPHEKTNKMACAPSKDSDQPGHQPSLISLRCPHDAREESDRLGECPGWSESSLGAHSLCWFCHVAAHLYCFLETVRGY